MRLSLGPLLLCLFVSLSYGVIVTPITNCPDCNVIQHVYPSSTQIVLLMSDNTVFVSNNEGLSFAEVASGISHIYQFPSNPQALIFRNYASLSYYLTLDGGNTNQGFAFPVLPLYPGIWDGVILSPRNAGYMAVFPNSSNVWGNYTKDYGMTWTPFSSDIHYHGDASWSWRDNSNDTFFAIRELNSDGSYHFAYTTDYGASWNGLVQNAHNFTMTPNFMFAIARQPNNTALQLYSNNIAWDPTHTNASRYFPCEFDFNVTLNATVEYQILADVFGSEIIGVAHNATTDWGSLFTSSFSGVRYDFSLYRIAIMPGSNNFDLALVNSLPGVYFANQLFTFNDTFQIKTALSINSGGSWDFIEAPDTDRNGNPYNCNYTAGCSLNLHAAEFPGNFPGLDGPPTALGFVVATGNVGQSLEFDPNTTATFYSWDGGRRWKELWNETTSYHFGNQGGMIVFGSTYVKNELWIHYSFDHGNTTQSVQLTNALNLPMGVAKIYSSSYGQSARFIVLASNYIGVSFIYHLDFTDQLNVTCNNNTDYELWWPSDGQLGNYSCFNGANIVFLRKIFNHTCFDNITDHFVSYQPCPCTWEDYHCDLGFFPTRRNETNGFQCVPMDGTVIIPCYNGYRLVPNTRCTLSNGLNLINFNCSDTTSTLSSTLSSTTGSTSDSPNMISSTATFFPLTVSSISSASSTTGATSRTPTSSSSSTSTSGEPVTTTTGGGSGSHAGLAVGLTFMFLIIIALVFLGVMYWRHDGFHTWVDQKIGRGDASAQPILSKK